MRLRTDTDRRPNSTVKFRYEEKTLAVVAHAKDEEEEEEEVKMIKICDKNRRHVEVTSLRLSVTKTACISG